MITKQISFGVEAQLQAVKELLAEEVSGIAMTPYNDERIRDCINTLYEQGIPVVTLNTDIENSRRIAYVGSNYTRSGATPPTSTVPFTVADELHPVMEPPH